MDSRASVALSLLTGEAIELFTGVQVSMLIFLGMALLALGRRLLEIHDHAYHITLLGYVFYLDLIHQVLYQEEPPVSRAILAVYLILDVRPGCKVVLFLTRMEEEHRELKPLNLKPIVRNVVDMIQAWANEKHIVVNIHGRRSMWFQGLI